MAEKIWKFKPANQDEAREFEQWAFDKGYSWFDGDSGVGRPMAKYFYVYDDNDLTWSSHDGNYQQCFAPEWQPKGSAMAVIKYAPKNQEESRAFQEWVFAQGGEWLMGQEVQYLNQPYLFFDSHKSILGWGDDKAEYDAEDATVWEPEPIEAATNQEFDTSRNYYYYPNDYLTFYAFQVWALSEGYKWGADSGGEYRFLGENNFPYEVRLYAGGVMDVFSKPKSDFLSYDRDKFIQLGFDGEIDLTFWVAEPKPNPYHDGQPYLLEDADGNQFVMQYDADYDEFGDFGSITIDRQDAEADYTITPIGGYRYE